MRDWLYDGVWRVQGISRPHHPLLWAKESPSIIINVSGLPRREVHLNQRLRIMHMIVSAGWVIYMLRAFATARWALKCVFSLLKSCKLHPVTGVGREHGFGGLRCLLPFVWLGLILVSRIGHALVEGGEAAKNPSSCQGLPRSPNHLASASRLGTRKGILMFAPLISIPQSHRTWLQKQRRQTKPSPLLQEKARGKAKTTLTPAAASSKRQLQ